jgi:hypothetical protein
MGAAREKNFLQFGCFDSFALSAFVYSCLSLSTSVSRCLSVTKFCVFTSSRLCGISHLERCC